MLRGAALLLALVMAPAGWGYGSSGPAAGATGGEGQRPKPIEVQVLALNDFHGNLEPPAGSSGEIEGTEAGGAEFLATHVAELEATNPRNTIVVSAGDLIGASPLLSALFHDEPTIEAMNEIGLDLNGVGNHEFDEGTGELRRMSEGGCHPVDGCLGADDFAGADFQFLAANVVSQDTGETLFPPYAIERFGGGAKVAFIGMTLEGTPTIVTPEGVAGFDFLDEADTANALVGELRRQRVENIIVLLHEGGFPAAGSGFNGCTGISGPIVDIVERLDGEIAGVRLVAGALEECLGPRNAEGLVAELVAGDEEHVLHHMNVTRTRHRIEPMEPTAASAPNRGGWVTCPILVACAFVLTAYPRFPVCSPPVPLSLRERGDER
jgi:5'-nucleotidase